uniref:Small nuclear ribonucleoprotein U11/U12 subunit 48 n=1 Tax=Junco hyemalis TaxID=40217 RepID=A0A8C5J6M5_JUNHY
MAAPVAAMAARSAVWLGGDPVEWVLCPYDVHHRVPRASLERHAASCRLRRMGYSAEEEAEMYDSSFFYGNLKVPSIAMDKDLQFHIVKQARAQSVKEGAGYSEGSYSLLPIEVPQNHKRFTCDLTQADRLALYDYVVEETKKQRSRSQITENDSDLFVDLAAKITQDDSQKGPKSHLEILAEMRDYKRRRQSYRAKNVHITKKSYTEVIRDVIGVHMEELSNQWQEENRLDNSEICEGGKSKSSGRYATADSFFRHEADCNFILPPSSNSTYQHYLSHMHSLFYTNSIKSCLRNSACMEDGEKLISIFLSEVSRLVASDSAEQLVSGGAGG